MNYYKNQLQLAEENKIDASAVYIAQEVIWNFGKDCERFEETCLAVNKIWMHTDHISIGDIAYALHEKIENDEVTLDDVLKDNYQSVIEYAVEMMNE